MYDMILNTLISKFKYVEGKKKNYFFDDDECLVATVDQKSITMFYSFPKCNREIFNHKGRVAVSFVKDFNLNGDVCDIIYISGLCGACNDVQVHEDYAIFTDVNNEIWDYLPDYDDDECDKKFGNCGYLTSQDSHVSFDICELIHFKNCRAVDYVNQIPKVNKNEKPVNLIAFKGKKDTDYAAVYKYHRKEANWYFKAGYETAGSDSVRDYVGSKSHRTINKAVINHCVRIAFSKPIIKFIVQYIRAQIADLYTASGERSLNATKLLMTRKTKECLAEFKSSMCNSATIEEYDAIIDLVLSAFDFNQRKIDKKRNIKIKKLSR